MKNIINVKDHEKIMTIMGIPKNMCKTIFQKFGIRIENLGKN